MDFTVALFGEANRGEFRTAYYCKSLDQLSDLLGEPPSSESKGLYFAVQALLFQREVIYFRVHEEGFSIQDYLSGLNLLENKNALPHISALCLPGVGSEEIIEATSPICSLYKSFLILTEKDLYDFLTNRPLNQKP